MQRQSLPYKERASSSSFENYGQFELQGDNHVTRLENLVSHSSIQQFLRDYPRETAMVESQLDELLREPEPTGHDEREQRLLEAFKVEVAETLPRRWTKNNKYHKHLKTTYNEIEVPLTQYDLAASRLRKLKGGDSPVSLKQMIVQDWEAALKNRRLKRERVSDGYIVAEMESRFRVFRELVRVLAPFKQYLAFSWSLSSANFQESIFDIVKQSDEIMRNEARINAIAKQLGRLQEAERSIANQTLKEQAQPERWQIDHAARSSLVGIRESDEISNIISSEAVLLASPETEMLFYAKFAEKKLLTYDYQAEERVSARQFNKPRRRVPLEERGPLILAVDTSASMEGKREQHAKALALSLTRIAFGQNRSVHLISFSNQTDSITLSPSGGGSLDALIRFLLMSFHGGTSLSVALSDALKLFEVPTFRRADLLFLTDGEAPPFADSDVAAMNKARATGVRFYSLLVGNSSNEELLAQFDYNWRYDQRRIVDLAINLNRYRLQTLTSSKP